MSITKKIDRVTEIPIDWQQSKLPAPPAVKIELTAHCNLKCWFCATGDGLREKGHMDFDLFKELAWNCKKAGVEELGLFYLGESFLYPHLVEAVKYAKEECGFKYVFLTTNGLYHKTEKTEALFTAGLDSLKFSLNAGSEKQYREHTGVNGFYLQLRNIRTISELRDKVEKETGHRCGIYASSILYDEAQRDLMQPVIDSLKDCIDEHYWLPLYSQAGLKIDGDDVLITAGVRGRLDNLRDPLPCWAVFREGHIKWDGMLSACCFDHKQDFEMGDLTKVQFKDAWNSDKFRALRIAHLTKDVTGTPCENCIAYQGD